MGTRSADPAETGRSPTARARRGRWPDTTERHRLAPGYPTETRCCRARGIRSASESVPGAFRTRRFSTVVTTTSSAVIGGSVGSGVGLTVDLAVAVAVDMAVAIAWVMGSVLGPLASRLEPGRRTQLRKQREKSARTRMRMRPIVRGAPCGKTAVTAGVACTARSIRISSRRCTNAVWVCNDQTTRLHTPLARTPRIRAPQVLVDTRTCGLR